MTQRTVRPVAGNRLFRQRAAFLLPALLPGLLASGLAGCGKPGSDSRPSIALAAPPAAADRGSLTSRLAGVAPVHTLLREHALSTSPQRPRPGALAAARPASGTVAAAAKRRTGAAPRPEMVARSTRPSAMAYRLAPGERQVYALEYSSNGASDFRALFASQKSAAGGGREVPSDLNRRFQTSFRGKLVATVIEQKPDRVLLAYSLRQPEVRIQADGQEAAAEAETVRRDLGREIFATVTRRGRLLSVRFDPAVGNLSQNSARTLLALTQVVLPAEEAARHSAWLTREEDPSGAYVARYEWAPGARRSLSGEAVWTFHKSIVHYLQPRRETRPDEFTVPTAIRTTGGLTGHFDGGTGRVVSLSGSQEQAVMMNGRQVAHTTTTLRVTLLGKEAVGPSELAALRTMNAERVKVAAAVPLFVPESHEATEATIQRNQLGSDTLDTLLAALVQVEADPNASDTTLYLKFKALVFLHPEVCPRLGELLTAAGPRSRTMPLLAGALGSVGHPAAQAALVRAIRAHPGDWPALSMLIPTLGGVPAPTPAAEATLRELAWHSRGREIASTAELSLGIMARNLARPAPARAAKIVQEMLHALRSARSPEAMRQHLLALGNTGASRALPSVARCMKSSSPTVRAAATGALRWIETSAAGRLLTRALAGDPDAGVRLEAAVALGARSMDSAAYAVQKRALLSDRGVDVRLAVLSNLWRAREAFPEVRDLVRQVAARDRAKDVRKAATEMAAG